MNWSICSHQMASPNAPCEECLCRNCIGLYTRKCFEATCIECGNEDFKSMTQCSDFIEFTSDYKDGEHYRSTLTFRIYSEDFIRGYHKDFSIEHTERVLPKDKYLGLIKTMRHISILRLPKLIKWVTEPISEVQ